MTSFWLAEFNWQQTLASGVIGAGAGVIVAAILGLVRKPPAPPSDEEGNPKTGAAPKKLNPVLAVLLVLVGLGLIVAGVAWRVKSQH